MSIRLTVLLGLIVLISLGLLMACGSHYSSSSDGLVIAPSQGSAVLQSFSFNLSNGHISQISAAPAVPGNPTAIILDPTGAFAYVAISTGSIAGYKVNSDGSLSSVGSPASMNPAASGVISPVAFAMDSSGKFLFVADQATTSSSGAPVVGSVSVFAVSSGTVTEAPGSPFLVPQVLGGAIANVVAVAVSPTVFPTLTGPCVTKIPPTTENLYVVDQANDQVWEFAVDSGTGALGPPGIQASAPGLATGLVPSGVAVDPCNRFVYVANRQSNSVSGYTICNTVSPNCPQADGSLVSVGATAPAGNGPTAIAVDPFGNFVYAVDTDANAISGFKISQVGGALTALSPATVATGTTPVSIAIRADANWLFVANLNSESLSQYAITPASGALEPLPTITTDNFPSGVVVK